MYYIKLLVVALSALLFLGVQCEVTEYANYSMRNYDSFADVYVVMFQVDDRTASVDVHMVMSKTNKHCQEKNIRVFVQFASLPIVKMTNKTFSTKFITNRHHSYHTNFTTADKSKVLRIDRPLRGDWYVAIALPHLKSKDIRQSNSDCVLVFGECKILMEEFKGLGVSCGYLMSTTINITRTIGHTETRTVDTAWKSTISPGQNSLYRIFMNETTISASIHLKNYTQDLFNITILAGSGQEPTLTDNVRHITCVEPECVVDIPSSRVDTWLFISVTNNLHTNADVELLVKTNDSHSSPNIAMLPPLEAIRHIDVIHTLFGSRMNKTIKNASVTAKRHQDTIAPFKLDARADVGGTLMVGAKVKSQSPAKCTADVILCSNYASIYTHSIPAECTATMSVDLHKKDTQKMYIPYPQSGNWFITLAYTCKDPKSCCDNVTLTFDIAVHSCVEGQCANQGVCHDYYGHGLVSVCACIAGWEGYDCTDDTYVLSKATQLIEVLLLTLSNLFFIPAIVIACRRKFYMEAVVYFSNMFFSSFYHACDVDSTYKMCITDYAPLSYADFFGSILSLWVTTIAVNGLGDPWHSVLIMTGIIGIEFGVISDRHSLWVFVIPLAFGISLAFGSWGWKCRKTRKCYPTSRQYWLTFVIGCLFALIGVCLFSLVETTANYKYTHSAWHMLMALAIALVLPHRPSSIGKSSMSELERIAWELRESDDIGVDDNLTELHANCICLDDLCCGKIALFHRPRETSWLSNTCRCFTNARDRLFKNFIIDKTDERRSTESIQAEVA